jgi:hypothetical protein
MPISESEFREPKLTKYKERYPMSYDKNQRYTDTIVNPMVDQARSNSVDGSGWKSPGYNPSHNSTRLERVNLTVSDPSYKPY